MKRFKLIALFVLANLIISGCQTFENKTNNIVQKENEKLSEYIGKTLNELKIDLGKPNEDYMNEKGNFELVYRTKKLGIPRERKFEINSSSIVIGFTSKGCF